MELESSIHFHHLVMIHHMYTVQFEGSCETVLLVLYRQSMRIGAGTINQEFLLPTETKFLDGGSTYLVDAVSYLPRDPLSVIEIGLYSTALASKSHS